MLMKTYWAEAEVAIIHARKAVETARQTSEQRSTAEQVRFAHD
jgi:hypothetical protein